MRGDRGKWACGFEATAAATEEADTAEGGKAVLEKWGEKVSFESGSIAILYARPKARITAMLRNSRACEVCR